MNISEQLGRHFREIHFGGNWSCSCLQDNLKDVSLEQALLKVDGINTIATLVYHTTYYVNALHTVLLGKEFKAKDELSFLHPKLETEMDWLAMVHSAMQNAEQVAKLIEQLPDEIWSKVFVEEKYGTWFRNVTGIIEHMHYHLGQIVMIKKLLASNGIIRFESNIDKPE